MATLGAGYKARCGIGKESVEGTLVAPTELLPFLSADIKSVATKAAGDALLGKNGYEDIEDVVKWAASGSLELLGDYQALDLIFAMALGSPAAVSGGSAPYTHAITLLDEFTKFASLAIDKSVEDFYLHGTLVNDFTWKSAPDNVGVSLGVVGNKITRGTTHHAALIALAHTLGRRVYHHHAVLRIADCADALAAGDAIAVSDITINMNNALATDDYTTTSGKYISGLVRGGKRNITLSFTLPRFAANTFFAAQDSETMLQADLIYTGPTLGAGTYKMTWQFPTLKVISNSADIGGPDLIPNVVECKAYRNNGNTPMTTVTEEFDLTILNARSTSIWA